MRRALIGAAVVLVIAAGAMFIAARSLRQGELLEAIEARLSSTLGQPVSIGHLDVSVLPRVSVTGRDIRVGDAAAVAPSISIGRVRILPRLAPLFSGHLVVKEMRLDEFSLSILRDETGRWSVPPAVPAPSAGDQGGTVIERIRVAGGRVRIFERERGTAVERASVDDVDTGIAVEQGTLRFTPIAARIGGSAVTGEGSIDAAQARLRFTAESIADDALPAFLALLGSARPDSVRLSSPASLTASIRVDRTSSRLSGSGTLRAPQVVADPLTVQTFAAPFVIDGPRVVFEPASFALYGGTHRGRIVFDTSVRPSTWMIDGRLDSVDAGNFLRALNGREQTVDGSLAVSAALRGTVGEPLVRTVRGQARMAMTDGVIRDFPLLAAIARALQLAEQSASDTKFSSLSATLAIEEGSATTDDLVMQSSDLRLHASGRIGADQSLTLRGVAVLSAARSKSAISSIHELSGLRNSKGEVEVPLTISGTLDEPSFFIDIESIVRKGIADELRRRLKRIIR